VKELVVISGKGGTGKTSLVASFASLASGQAVFADCDVDAADLHLVLEPTIKHRETFSGGKRARINPELCTACGKCQTLCRFDVIAPGGPGATACDDCDYCARACSTKANSDIQQMLDAQLVQCAASFAIDPVACEGCGVCAWFCPANAIEFVPAINGEWFISDTRHGPMVHAKLGIAEENSGKLVSTVRTEARKIAEANGLDTIIIDGPPGIGCPVIASVTGSDRVLIVTEPTLSGQHDLDRVAKLTQFFDIPTMVCVNKWDLNPQIAAEIELQAHEQGIQLAGRVRYEPEVTAAQIQRRSIHEHLPDGATKDIRAVWETIEQHLGNT
jgi:MinD superfamily P-loop ATPase